MHTVFWVENIIMSFWKIWWQDVDWIHLAQDRNYWQAFVNKAMSIRVE
jgi:hypothetical protein